MRTAKPVYALLFAVTMTFTLAGCTLQLADENSSTQSTAPSVEAAVKAATTVASPLDSWVEDGVIEDIVAFVNKVCNEDSKNYVPAEQRIAVWDVDGTFCRECNSDGLAFSAADQLFVEYAQTYRASNDEIKEALEAYEEVYEGYVSGIVGKYDYYDALYELIGVVVHDKTPESIMTALDRYLNDEAFDGMTYVQSAYKPMTDLYYYLIDHGFKVYFVTGSMRSAAYVLLSSILDSEKHTLSYDSVKGTDFLFKEGEASEANSAQGVVCDEGTGDINIQFTKCELIAREIGMTPIMAIGNSTNDVEMLDYVLSNNKYPTFVALVNHDDSNREVSYDALKIQKLCSVNKYTCISMRCDFECVFEDD